ncbi:MAG: bifunctional 5,10-methylenetetrahydrofolate dehydrogenase/5,10-methenyltetrahydrofolate cyclohydrolase [Clostridia bacterium]|nr:bifunctional 5,10-methylenetetrahydrofolate dehydrogenase/5,10-methenyltetrahydrofolate cyclohydrolase [Clostridia bacterium]
MSRILDGKEVARVLTEGLQNRSQRLGEKGITPTLAIVRMGEKPEDMAYERGALKRAEKVGVQVRQVVLDADEKEEMLLDEINKLNRDEKVHGIIVFRPLPKHIDDEKVRNAIAAAKDVDGVTDASMAFVYSGGHGEGFAPCTASACMEVLRHYEIPVKGRRAVVVGRSLVIGRPVANLLLAADATVSVAHTKTVNLPEFCRSAEILIAAAGRAGMITADFVSENQVILDVGVNFTPEGKMTGDVAFDEVSGIVSALTPVPGGIGAVTSTILMKHVVEAAEKTEKNY